MVSSSASERPVGDLHRVDVADQVGDRDVGRGELLDVALVAVHPARSRSRRRARPPRASREPRPARTGRRGSRSRRPRAPTRRAAPPARGSCGSSPGRARRGRSGRGRRAARSRPRGSRCRRSRGCPGRAARRRAACASRFARISSRSERGRTPAARAPRACVPSASTCGRPPERRARLATRLGQRSRRGAAPVSMRIRCWMISRRPSSSSRSPGGSRSARISACVFSMRSSVAGWLDRKLLPAAAVLAAAACRRSS